MLTIIKHLFFQSFSFSAICMVMKTAAQVETSIKTLLGSDSLKKNKKKKTGNDNIFVLHIKIKHLPFVTRFYIIKKIQPMTQFQTVTSSDLSMYNI